MPDIVPEKDQLVAIDKFESEKSCLIGDEMGVGKTVTAIGRDFRIREKEGPLLRGEDATLIVCEKIGLTVWDYHLRAMGVPASEIMVIDPKNRTPFENALSDYSKGFSGPRYFIVHYDVLDRIGIFSERRGAKGTGKLVLAFLHVIADEVHLAKNRKAKRTIALKRIVGTWKTGLTGTPADNKPDDFWSPLNWLRPDLFRSYWKFYEQFIEYETVETFMPGRGVVGYRKASGVKNLNDLHERIGPFYIRRTLREINPEMPQKIYVEPSPVVDLTPAMRRQYRQMETIAMTEIGYSGEDWVSDYTLLAPAQIAVLTRLQQMALATLSVDVDDWAFADSEGSDMPSVVLCEPSPKLDYLMNLVETQESESFVVFTQFRGMADLVESKCQAKGIPVSKITGEVTSVEDRARAVARFQDGESRVFVGTIAAAGKTITLTRAHIAVFLDRSWNPSLNVQAEGRIFRRTQTENCLVIDIKARDTVDQSRMQMIERKARWNQDMVTARTDRPET